MGLVRTLVLGRPDGLRSRLLRVVGIGSPEPASTDAAQVSPAAFGGGATNTRPVAPAATAASDPAEKVLGLRKEPPKDVTPPEGYEVVLHRDALEAGRIIEIIIAGTAIAVANVGGTFYAISNACPHAEGPLGEGSLEGCVLTCPYHGWQFDVSTGACKTNPYAKVTTYPTQVVGEAVCVKL